MPSASRSASPAAASGIASKAMRAHEANCWSASKGARTGTASLVPQMAKRLQAIPFSAGGASDLSRSISLRCWSAGAVWAAGGTLTHPGHPCIDQCVASIQFENGHIASWIQGDASLGGFTSKFFFELFGAGRSVQLYDRLKKATFLEGENTWVEERADEEGFQLENEEFVSALQQGRQPELSAHDGIQATRMVLAADKAIRTGEVQEL